MESDYFPVKGDFLRGVDIGKGTARFSLPLESEKRIVARVYRKLSSARYGIALCGVSK